MTSFIIVSTDKKKREIYIKDFCLKHTIDQFDQTNLTLETSSKQTSQSIGIEDIKLMQKKIFLKPIKSQKKAVIIEDAQLLTHEAQNALLKLLEEPPAHTLIFLSTDKKGTLLPTILSRCQIIELETETLKLSEKEHEEFEIFFQTLSEWGIGERLKKAETLAKDKDKAIAWIEKIIIVMRGKILQNTKNVIDNETMKQWSKQIKSFQKLHTLLKTTNVNPRFAIENTLLNL